MMNTLIDRRAGLIAIFMMMVIAGGASIGHAQTTIWYVNINQISGANTGTSWPDAFQGPLGPRNALLAAGPGDEVWIAAGTYDSTMTIDLKEDVSVYGGFVGTETRLDQRDPAVNITELRAGSPVLRAIGVDDIRLDGLRIVGGTMPAGVGMFGGGGLHAARASLIVDGCHFQNNSSGHVGGAVLAEASTLTVIDSTYTGNNSVSSGGAIALTAGSIATVDTCTFSQNASTSGGALAGVSAGPLSVTGCTFTSNVSVAAPGGHAVFSTLSDTVDVADSVFLANGFVDLGAGTVTADGDLRLTGCRFDQNRGPRAAGVWAIDATVAIDDCVFIDNQASGTAAIGGALLLERSIGTLRGSAFIMNSASVSGGGLMIVDGNLFGGVGGGGGGGGGGDGAAVSIHDCDFCPMPRCMHPAAAEPWVWSILIRRSATAR